MKLRLAWQCCTPHDATGALYAAAEGGGAPAADMEEVDMDGVGDAWGDDDGLDLGGDVETPAIGDEDMDGLEGEEGEEEEGGWEMEVRPCPVLGPAVLRRGRGSSVLVLTSHVVL